MNSWNGIGRLTADPDVRYTNDGMAIATFSIAIDRPVKQGQEKKADFPRIVVFGKAAENCEKYLAKGRLVGITGRIQTGKYQNQEGRTIYTTDVVAERVKFLEWGDRQDHGNTQAQESPYGSVGEDIGDGFMNIPDGIDEDLPFM